MRGTVPGTGCSTILRAGWARYFASELLDNLLQARKNNKKRFYDTVDKGEVADGQFLSLLPPYAHMKKGPAHVFDVLRYRFLIRLTPAGGKYAYNSVIIYIMKQIIHYNSVIYIMKQIIHYNSVIIYIMKQIIHYKCYYLHYEANNTL
jgi:hypothetical protein